MTPKNNPRLLLIALCLTIFITSARSRDPADQKFESGDEASHFGRLLSASSGVNPALKKICDNTDHPDICLSKLGPLVQGKPTADSVLEASFKAGADAAREALAKVKAAAKKSPPNQSSTYKDCVDFYKEVIENFGKSAQAHPEKDKGTMQTDLSAIMTFLETCEDEFTEAGETSPFKELGEKLTQIASDSLAIVDQLH